MRSLLVLPTYEESGTIARVLRAVRTCSPDTDVLVVDDGSPDGTADLAEAEGTLLGKVTVTRRTGKLGLGSAYRDGFRWGLDAGYDLLIEMDADMSHDPEDLPRLIAAIEGGADLAIGSRYIPGGSIPAWAWHRRALSLCGNAYARWALGIAVHDMTSGFRAYRSSLLSKVPLERVTTDGYGFQIDMVRQAILAGGRVVEIPICFAERAEGRSKMSRQILTEALVSVTAWAARDRIPFARGRAARARSGASGGDGEPTAEAGDDAGASWCGREDSNLHPVSGTRT